MKKIRDITPDDILQACWPLPGCPAIFDSEDGKEYYLIGKVMDSKKLGITQRVGDGEIVVAVPKRLVDERKT